MGVDYMYTPFLFPPSTPLQFFQMFHTSFFITEYIGITHLETVKKINIPPKHQQQKRELMIKQIIFGCWQ